jgi:hypothetical protein
MGNIKTTSTPFSSVEYVLKEDIERDEILNKGFSPIGEFIFRPGTVVRTLKNTYLYTKPAKRIGGIDKNSIVFLKQGTQIRILQYDYNSLVNLIAVVEILD